MRKFTVVFALLAIGMISSCSHSSTIEEQRVARVEPVKTSPLVSPISSDTVVGQSISKPRPSLHDKNYTAPYPKLSNSTTVVSPLRSSTAIDPNVVKRTSLITTTTKTRTTRPLTTQDFLSGTTTTTVVTPISTEYGANVATKADVDDEYNPAEHPVYEKAIALPPKTIEEGRYRTFRGIEDGIAYDTRKVRGKLAEFIFPEMNDIVEKPKGIPQPAAYCYKSMGYATCYDKPIPGQDFRLVGKPDPRF